MVARARQTVGRARCRADFAAGRGHADAPEAAAGPADEKSRAVDRLSSPLHAAAYSGDLQMARLLLDAGTEANVRTLVGETPLHLAAENGHAGLVQLLLSRGAAPDARDQHGDSALHYGAARPEVVRLLLAHGAAIDSANRAGDRPLHAAAFGGHPDAVRQLLGASAAVDAVGQAGETPLAIAALRGHTEALRCLLERGASVGATDDGGGTALHAAAEFGALKSGKPDAVQLLIGAGAAATAEVVELINKTARLLQARAAAAAAPAAFAGHSAAWKDRMRRMPPLTRRLLVENEPPPSFSPLAVMLEQVPAAIGGNGSIDNLTKYRGARAALMADVGAAVLRVPAAIGADGCGRLRWAVDNNGSVSTDVVDGLPNRDLGLGLPDLEAILGRAPTRALVQLTRRFNELPSRAEHAPRAMDLVGAFARRYSADTPNDDQPLTSFHFDSAAVTVNVALTDDATLAGGGRLLGLVGGAVRAIERGEGEATVHSSSLLHGVTRVREGVRYSLIMFFAFR